VASSISDTAYQYKVAGYMRKLPYSQWERLTIAEESKKYAGTCPYPRFLPRSP